MPYNHHNSIIYIFIFISNRIMYVNYIAILLSICIILLKRFSNRICQFFQVFLSKPESSETKRLKNELNNLKAERDSYNMIDQFAKYVIFFIYDLNKNAHILER